MDNILRGLEDLSRHELVWLNTYLAGRLRALPPENVQQLHPLPKAMPNVSAAPGTTCSEGLPAATVAPLPERIDALNHSLDPWERTGAAPQGWANHLQQAMVPIQGYYIQLRPQTMGSLPAFGASRQSTPGCTGDTDAVEQHAPRRIGKASPSVSIFARDPLCKNTCRYCRCRPCDVGIEHDDHACYDCEQRLLHPEGVPGAPWQPPLTPGCESWCTQCTSQRCAVRGLHDLHVCMGCERAMTCSTPVEGGDPWAAPEWSLVTTQGSMRIWLFWTEYRDIANWYWYDDDYVGTMCWRRWTEVRWAVSP